MRIVSVASMPSICFTAIIATYSLGWLCGTSATVRTAHSRSSRQYTAGAHHKDTVFQRIASGHAGTRLRAWLPGLAEERLTGPLSAPVDFADGRSGSATPHTSPLRDTAAGGREKRVRLTGEPRSP